MKRGEIWWAELPSPGGSGPGYRRPVLVVQADPFNRSRISTVVTAIISSNLNVSQLVTLDRKYLSDRAGKLSPKQMTTIDEGLRLILSV